MCVFPGEKVCFSAGLSRLPLRWEVGFIRFNEVLVNDGGHYNRRTGVFTAPLTGRYHLSAVLTARRGARVEAVLSVSNRIVQKLNTAGFPRSGAEVGGPCACGGGVATLNLVLGLQRGWRVGLKMTVGELAVTATASSAVQSTFSAVLLYPSPDQYR
ncbi:hypothetical protein CRUP_023823 [Coryphaenoides rupestris]|nr:hypothetical protein CRUP_023823 [Coryphaenoides rupestris]